MVQVFSPAAFIGYDWTEKGGIYDPATQSWVPLKVPINGAADDTVDAFVVYGVVGGADVVTPPGYTVDVNLDATYVFDENVHDLDAQKAAPGYNNNIQPGDNLVPCLDDATTVQLTWSSAPFNEPQVKKH